MFRNRRNKQKPAPELYAAFKKDFPHVGLCSPTSISVTTASESAPLLSTPAVHTMDPSQSYLDLENSKAHDSLFGNHEAWRFTPSALDTNSFSFSHFAQPEVTSLVPGSGAMASNFHSQPHDLQTPGAPFQLGTPLSSDDSHPSSATDIHGFQPHLLHAHSFQPHADLQQQQQSFAPSNFVHQDSGYETVDQTRTPVMKRGQMVDSTELSRYQDYPADSYCNSAALAQAATPDKFRFQVTLNAPTAMIKHSDEIPLTYLNKGQAYAISINDSTGVGLSPHPVRYRTVIRISFEDEEHRQRPSACWQLWKEGRGLAEAHLRDGRLQAVEYVDPNHGADPETRHSRVDLEMASFDSFAVTWSPNPGSATADCNLAVRFNFLSTDFSHSKGVKGIPVRLCAKTEILSSGTPESMPCAEAEVCFCKVKLFRDHGAERKLSNDIAHIKKTIDKVKHQISQVEHGAKDSSKRKRSDPAGQKAISHKAGKVQKRKRTWSMSSQGSNGRPTVEDDLHVRLATMQDMFSSTRPVSMLYLKGYEHDDPDEYPVTLAGEPIDLSKVSQFDRRVSQESAMITDGSTSASGRSPTATDIDQPDSKPSEHAQTLSKSEVFPTHQQDRSDWENFTNFENHNFAFDTTTRIPRENTGHNMPSWIEAFGVEDAYQPPAERCIKPIACFYVLIKFTGSRPESDVYQAVYLMERTLQDLVRNITSKCGVTPGGVRRVLRINNKGLKILVDDESVRELPEGQDMMVEFTNVETAYKTKEEPTSGQNTPKASETPTKSCAESFEMRLIF